MPAAPDPIRLELLSYDLPRQAVEAVLPIASLLADDELEAGERLTAVYVREQLAEIEAGGDPLLADQTIMLLDFWIDEQLGDEEFSDDFEIVIEECLALHDWGTEYGPDVPVLKEALSRLLARR